MQLEGIHHVTAITGDAPANVDFYAGVLGLRLVKKTVNQDDPTVYHLFYADEQGSPGADITFFEYPGARRGRAGAGMVHTIVVARRLRRRRSTSGSSASRARACDVTRADGSLGFDDPEGARARARVVDDVATSRSSPSTRRSRRSSRSRASTACARTRPTPSEPRRCSRQLGFERVGERAWEVRGEPRGGCTRTTPPPEGRGIPGAGTVHHVAWASTMEDHEAWQQRVAEAGARPTPVIDRFWFRSIYFREPSGVLFEIATLGPGFAVDEDPAHLGETLILPPAFEHLRAQIEPLLTPLPNPRASDAGRA